MQLFVFAAVVALAPQVILGYCLGKGSKLAYLLFLRNPEEV